MREDIEKWVPAYGFDGFYEISNHGRIKSIRRNPPLIRKVRKSNEGYFMTTLRGKCITVHRLMLISFNGLPPSKEYQVCHLNGIRTDNRLSNLKWGSPKENQGHRAIHNTKYCGEKCLNRIITDKISIEIRRLHNIGLTGKEIAGIFNIKRWVVSSVITGISWKHTLPKHNL